jgi:ammonium transporter Rh
MKRAKGKRIDPVVFAFCMLAGLVGTSSALFIVGIWGGLLIGAISGILSVASFNYLHEPLSKLTGYLDVMGVHNLHGICSWVSMITGTISVHVKGGDGYMTLVAFLATLGIALATGGVSGLILKFTKFGELSDEAFMNDKADFELGEAKEGNDGAEP